MLVVGEIMIKQLEPLFDKKVKCLLCDAIFTTKKVRSNYSRAVHIESDFFTEFSHEEEEVSPLLYHVNVCPSCGYSFSDEAGTYFRPGTKDELLNKITRNWQGHEFYCNIRSTKEAIQSYKLAIFSGQIKQERPIVMAGYHMRLSWIYRKLSVKQEEKRFMEYALHAYEKAYFDGDYKNSQMSSIRLAYLIGELYRKCGNYQKASSYFSKLIHVKEATKDRRFIEMARDQWYEMRENQRGRIRDR